MRSQYISASGMCTFPEERRDRNAVARPLSLAKVYRLIALSCFVCLPSADLVLAQSATSSALNSNPTFRPIPSSVQMPAELVGAWQTQIEGRAFKLRANYNIEIKINDSRSNLPTAIVSYFAGDANRPSTICRSQLMLVSTEGQSFVLGESLNYKGGKDLCPIWDQVTIEPRSGSLWLQWRDGGRRKPSVKMEAGAYRFTGGMECRLVSGDGGAGGQEWCRDAEGNWSPRRR